MRGTTPGNKAQLRFDPVGPGESTGFSRFADLIESVFAMKPEPAWPAIGVFDGGGRCVAGLQHRSLRLVCDGVPVPVAALRNVAVAPEWRGCGLMRDLMVPTLAWCDAHADLTLLYAETPALYAGQGFAALPQHAFEGPAPEPTGAATARPLDGTAANAEAWRLLATRSPASTACGVLDDGGMAEHKLRGGSWPVAHDAELDALIVHETDGETLVLGDVVAATIPPASRILGALGARPKRLRTLFPPDRLAWNGEPVAEDTGLMARGTLPAAMRRPFILPPTFDF